MQIVITTIQPPTSSVVKLAKIAQALTVPIIIIGDQQGPATYNLPGTTFYSSDAQRCLPYKLAHKQPFRHYSRKNLGYLIAIGDRASAIYETDDDNTPLPSWAVRSLAVDAWHIPSQPWFNTFSYFYQDSNIWPRGYPLARIRNDNIYNQVVVGQVISPLQQGLADGSPDVDAIFRLINGYDYQATTTGGLPVWLTPGTWCPVNSQSTWWFPPAYPFLYLPSSCSSRMADIWRGFVAQRCLWALGYGVVHHRAEVYQDRNPHNLSRDFEDEVCGYLGNDKITMGLGDLRLKPGVDSVNHNLYMCYEWLVGGGFLLECELKLIGMWLADLDLAGYKI